MLSSVLWLSRRCIELTGWRALSVCCLYSHRSFYDDQNVSFQSLRKNFNCALFVYLLFRKVLAPNLWLSVHRLQSVSRRGYPRKDVNEPLAARNRPSMIGRRTRTGQLQAFELSGFTKSLLLVHLWKSLEIILSYLVSYLFETLRRLLTTT